MLSTLERSSFSQRSKDILIILGLLTKIPQYHPALSLLTFVFFAQFNEILIFFRCPGAGVESGV